MQQSSLVCAVVVALLSGPALAEATSEQWHINSDIKQCVRTRLDEFLANFSSGSGACPYECANCLTDPLTCLTQCTNKAAACACSHDIPQALDSLATCCEYVWDILEGACHSAVRGLGETVVNQISHICMSSDEDLNAAMEQPGSLLVKTRSTVEEGAVAVISGLQAGAQQLPHAGSLLELASPTSAFLAQEGTAEYVDGHAMGSACLSMLEDVEREHAVVGEDGDVPDLYQAAAQIAERASGLLGRQLPALTPAVHKALALAWSEDGPGMDSRDVCEMILKHHDSL